MEDVNTCKKFKCIYTPEIIENEMMMDVKDPAVCGAKEPKIASLLWVLHDDPESEKNEEEQEETSESDQEKKQSKKGIITWLGQLFK